ncbi:hypothetical protein LIP_0908 [Limnochorda pilosa]|uniref:Uncharacterized protein n=1 Tax=Limnochorda pilosa TaxID=1555112 RepID=A0A0K2SI54_LIMPI|nr:hypothetical protein LIP_0908 [Limnochorda pilosa]
MLFEWICYGTGMATPGSDGAHHPSVGLSSCGVPYESVAARDGRKPARRRDRYQTKIGSIVIRCYEFDRMVAFWERALNYVA